MLNYNHVADLWLPTSEMLMSPPRGISLPWWPTVQFFLGGMRPNELTLLCAPTGAGKTALLANISAQLLLQNEPHFVAPVETGDTDFLTRVISVLEKRDLNTGEAVSGEEMTRLTAKYRDTVFTRGLYVANYDNRVEIQEMITLLKYMHQEYRCRVALLDNLNFFLKVVASTQEKAEMDNAIHEFVMLAKKIPMHIVLIVHPKKTEGGRVVSEFDIKGSSTAVQEASNVILFNRPDPKDVENGKADFTDRELVFRKIRRRGMHVGKPVQLAFDGGRYQEVVKHDRFSGT